MIEIFNEKFTTAPFQLNFTPLQNAAVMVTQDRNQQLIAQLFFVRLPIDIKKRQYRLEGPFSSTSHQ